MEDDYDFKIFIYNSFLDWSGIRERREGDPEYAVQQLEVSLNLKPETGKYCFLIESAFHPLIQMIALENI